MAKSLAEQLARAEDLLMDQRARLSVLLAELQVARREIEARDKHGRYLAARVSEQRERCLLCRRVLGINPPRDLVRPADDPP